MHGRNYFRTSIMPNGLQNPEIAKIQRIERSVPGYDNTVDAEMLDNQDNFGTDNLVLLNPYEIMRSGLYNTKFVDDAMLHLYLKDKFNDKKEGHLNFQRKFDTM